jgi:hypothetical protein
VVLDAGGVTQPRVALDPGTGWVYAVWQRLYAYQLDPLTISYRNRAGYAYWNGSAWSAVRRPVNDGDVAWVSAAAAPGGRVMLAWFQGWSDSLGGPTDPGLSIVPRTAYGSDPQHLALRQAVSAAYTVPEKEDSLLLAYAAADDKFYMFCEHLMWPGHSLVYRYTWNGSWSAPLDVAGNSADWAMPVYLGTAPGVASVYYVYRHNGLWSRRETAGVLDAPQNIDQYLADAGYSGTPVFFLGSTGAVHMAVAGTKDGAAGLYYLQQ